MAQISPITSPDPDLAFDPQALSDRHGLGPVSEKCALGAQFQYRTDPSTPDTIQNALDSVAPDFGRIIVEFVFGDIYARPGLDFKLRVFATLAAVAALNQTFAVKEYVRFALNAGWSRVEIVEVLMQISVYAGMGPAMDALAAAKETFGEIDTQP